MPEAFLGHPLVLRLGLTLLHTLWQGAALAGFLGLGLLVIGGQRSHLRHALASLVLLLWLATPLVTFALLAPSVTPVSAGADPTATVTHAAPSASVETSPSPKVNLPLDDPPTASALPGNEIADLRHLLPYAVLAWLLIASLLTLRLLGGLLLLQRLRRSGTALRHLQPRFLTLANRLGIRRRVELLASNRVDAPTAFGWLRPVVLLPSSALTGLNPQQLELILAHELAHIRRHDYLVNILQGVAEALLYHHPLTWWLSRILRTEREHACDALAMQVTGSAPLTLADALLRLETGRNVTAPALAASGSLPQRIHRLLGKPRPATSTPALLLPGLGIALLGCWLAIAAPGTGQHQGNDNESRRFFEHASPLTHPYFPPQGNGLGPNLTLAQASELATFPLRAPISLPAGLELTNAQWSEALQLAYLHYRAPRAGAPGRAPDYHIGLLQTPASEYQILPAGDNARVETVLVNGVTAEYVEGAWTSDPHRTSRHVPRWDPAAGSSLAWQQDGTVYVLTTQTNAEGHELPGREELIRAAQSLASLTSQPGTPAQGAAPLPEEKTRKWATLTGDITFTDDYSELKGIGSNGRVILEERTSSRSRRIIVTAGAEGELEYLYSEAGEPATFDVNARNWYEATLEELVLAELRATGGPLPAERLHRFHRGTDEYRSLLYLPGTYTLEMRQAHHLPWWNVALVVPLEELAQAAAHGLLSQELLQRALEHYQENFRLDDNESASLRYAAQHLDSSEKTQDLTRQPLDQSTAHETAVTIAPEIDSRTSLTPISADPLFPPNTLRRQAEQGPDYFIKTVPPADRAVEYAIAHADAEDPDRDYFIQTPPEFQDPLAE